MDARDAGADVVGPAPPDLSRPAATLEVVPATVSTVPSVHGSRHTAHVLVCVEGDDLDMELIRQGRVLADRLQARLTLLHPFALGEGDEQRQALARDRAWARSFGMPLVELPSYSPVEGIVEFARTRDVTHLVLSDAGAVPWYAAWRDDIPQQLARRLDRVDLYVVTDSSSRRQAGSK